MTLSEERHPCSAVVQRVDRLRDDSRDESLMKSCLDKIGTFCFFPPQNGVTHVGGERQQGIGVRLPARFGTTPHALPLFFERKVSVQIRVFKTIAHTTIGGPSVIKHFAYVCLASEKGSSACLQ